MIKNIVCDVGKVMLSFEPRKYLQSIFSKEKSQILYENIFASDEWLDLDRGTITNEEAIQIISNRISSEKENVDFVLKNWTEMLTPITQTVDVIRELKDKGYRLLIISNFHQEAYAKILDRFDFLKMFDDMLVSSHVHMLKPERQIFEYLCDTYEIKPCESIFIDDTKVNIDTACSMGFVAIHFTDPKKIKSEIFDSIGDVP